MIEFCNILCSTEKCISYMMSKGLLKNHMVCVCEEDMTLMKRGDLSDGKVWNCRKCLKRTSIRKNSFFENSRLPLEKLMQIIYGFGLDFQIYQCKKLMPEIDEKSLIDWYSFLRDVCSASLLRNPVKLGSGVDSEIVEIDESLFGKKRKYHRGSGNQKFWVFGMVERGTRNSVLQLVDKRDRETLLPIIKKYVVQGTTIYSDQWAAYYTIGEEGYSHATVNHSKEFKSADGCCTNGIEGLWGMAKLRIKKMKGIFPARLPAIIDEFMYRYRFGLPNGDIFNPLIFLFLL